MKEKSRLIVVVIYSSAMAWVESAAVVYLRTLIGRLQPYQPNPLSLSVGSGLAQVEAIREAATLTMLLAVGWLAGHNWRTRLAYTMVAFGTWDVLYYVFLAIIGPWPGSIWDWDILFLLPLPWWGPVLAPVLISVLLILSGILISQYDSSDNPMWPRVWAQVVCLAGMVLALYVFMSDSIRALNHGLRVEALGEILPAQFNWPLFLLAFVMMAVPVIDLGSQVWRSTHAVHQ